MISSRIKGCSHEPPCLDIRQHSSLVFHREERPARVTKDEALAWACSELKTLRGLIRYRWSKRNSDPCFDSEICRECIREDIYKMRCLEQLAGLERTKLTRSELILIERAKRDA